MTFARVIFALSVALLGTGLARAQPPERDSVFGIDETVLVCSEQQHVLDLAAAALQEGARGLFEAFGALRSSENGLATSPCAIGRVRGQFVAGESIRVNDVVLKGARYRLWAFEVRVPSADRTWWLLWKERWTARRELSA